MSSCIIGNEAYCRVTAQQSQIVPKENLKRGFIRPVSLMLILLVICLGINAASGISVQHMKCEYLDEPLGLDEPNPRFSWTLAATDTDVYGVRQTEYRILVAKTRKQLDKNKGDMWSSGWIKSDESQQIEYQGKPLDSDRTYYWKIQVKDQNKKKSGWSNVSNWSTGLFNSSDWSAKWIGTNEVYDTNQPDCTIFDPWFRKTVSFKEKPVRLIIYVASVGYHELYVNGEKIGDGVLAPCVSDHTTRARYIAYNIADKIKPGENTIGIWLGTSWSIFRPYGTEDKPKSPIVIAQGDVYYKDNLANNPSFRIQTDESWKCHPSPNKLLGNWASNNYGGEIWDANLEIPEWSLVSYNDSQWNNVKTFNPKLILSSQNVEETRLFDKINPIKIEERPDGSYRVDMGVNFAGWTKIKVKGKKGDRVDFLFSEREQEEITFNNHSAYIIGPSGEGCFQNRFNYSSGRWITIRGLKEKPLLSDISGWQVRTAYNPVSTFECSDSLQNWIYDRVCWTFKNLSIGGYVVDCPQRERLGYGGDAHATAETGLFNFGMGAFYTKWMQDWRDVQGWQSLNGKRDGSGVLPHTAPTNDGGGGPAWGGICVTLPWYVYQHQGDKRILEENFSLIVNWLKFLDSHTENNLLKRFGGSWDFLGDWLWPNANAEGMNNDKPETVCYNNCYRVFNLRTAAKIARVLGKEAEAVKWEEQANLSSSAIHAMFFDSADSSYADKSMGNLAAALLADVPPADLRDQVMKRLENEIRITRNGHIHVGITGGALLFKLLKEKGRDDLIYLMTSQTDYPGWGYMKANGATTIWEMWEKDLPGHSLLHSSYLYPGAWFIEGLGGIHRDSANPGFKRFIVRPPLLGESSVTWAKASFDSPVGMIKTYWKLDNGKRTLDVTVPPNSTAIVQFPICGESKVIEKTGHGKLLGNENGYALFELSSGSYSLTEVSL